jgi:thioester reductase-like protein
MSILRPACYKLFAPLINSIYDRFEKGTGAPKRHITSIDEMQSFLHTTISTALSAKASSDLTMSTDLFAYGVDSLQATRVRNDIIKSLELGDITLGQNVVYEHPSIERLAKYILDSVGGSAGASETAQEKMEGMLEKWSSRFADRSDSSTKANDEVVVLTGATGSLGAHILDQLTRRPEVKRVICLSRAKSHSDSTSRIQDSLSQRLRTLTPESQGKITSYSADVNKPQLGLTSEEYEDIRKSATSIIHNAWPVNFVLSIDSFEDHIGGAVNLLNLSLTSDHASTFYFSSSVGTRQGRPDPVVAEDFSDSPITAGGMGYGQSKWVVEKLCEKAAEIKGAKVGVLRIGQLVGDTENGVWNETEAWPLLFRAAITTGCLPELEERPTWLPVDEAGRAIAEIVLSKNQQEKAVYHVLSNKESKWADILKGLELGGVKFDRVDRMEWLERLAKSESDVEKNPTYKLLVSLSLFKKELS